MTRVVDVSLGDRSYRVLVGAPEGWISTTPHELSERGRRALLVTDAHVGPLWAAPVTDVLASAGLQVEILQLSAGEATKDLANLWSGSTTAVTGSASSGMAGSSPSEAAS